MITDLLALAFLFCSRTAFSFCRMYHLLMWMFRYWRPVSTSTNMKVNSKRVKYVAGA